MFNLGKYRIAIIKIGGLGDSITALWLAAGIKDKYPDSSISLYIRDKIPLLSHHPAIDNLVVTGYQSQIKLVDKIRKQYDIVFDDRYTCKVMYSTPDFDEDKRMCEDRFKEWEEYYIKFFDKLNDYDVNLLEHSFYTAGVDFKPEYFDLGCLLQNNRFQDILKPLRYIVIHNSGTSLRATKSWKLKSWNTLVKWIKEQNYQIMQVGNLDEELIENTVDLRGKMSLEDTMSLLKGANLLIDTEGGLVHLARGVNTKSLVLFGSTPIKCFGYKSNINLSSNLGCEGCWYTRNSEKPWYRECPIHYKPFCQSLYNLSPKVVIGHLKLII